MNIITKKNAITAFELFIGIETIFSNTRNGGCLGLRKSRSKVRFGTIAIVKIYTTIIPPDKAIPTVSIGFIGVNVRDINPITVVTADKNTARPVEDIDCRIFSSLVPDSSAYRLVIWRP